MPEHRVASHTLGWVLRRYALGIVASVLLGGCDLSGGQPSEPMPSTLSGSMVNEIAFVIIPYRSPGKSYDYRTRTMRSCEQVPCGSPISIVYDDGTVQHLDSVGGRGDKVAISPNRQHLVISDAYGIHAIHAHTVHTYKKSELTDSVRGIHVNDDGTFFSVEHVGSREVDGTVQFSSFVGWKYHDQYHEKLVGIDGVLVDCNLNPQLFSYGDEDDKKTHIYRFNPDQGAFEEQQPLTGAAVITPSHYHCQDDHTVLMHGDISKDLDTFDSETGYFSFNNGIVDSNIQEAWFDERPLVDRQVSSVYDGVFYSIGEPGNIHRYVINEHMLPDLNVYTFIPRPTQDNLSLTNASLSGSSLFLMSIDPKINRRIVSEINMQDNGKLISSTRNKYIDKTYNIDQIDGLFIFNPDQFRAWADREQY